MDTQRKSSTHRRPGRPKKWGSSSLVPSAADPSLSLPLATTPAATTAPTTMQEPCQIEEIPKNLRLTENSTIRTTALKIIAMRAADMTDAEIAKALGLAPSTIRPYLYKAGRNGFIDIFDDPKDQLEYQMLHKVVRNLNEGLDDSARHETSGMMVKTQVALKVAEMTIAKRFNEPVTAAQASTIVAIRIETPSGPAPEIREGTTGGTPAYLDITPGSSESGRDT